jgi:hypothetical protein
LRFLRWRLRGGVFAVVAATGLVVGVPALFAGSGASTGKSSERALTDAAEGSFDVLEQADQYAEARTAPGSSVSGAALRSAVTAASKLSSTGGSWSEITNKPYDSDAEGYRDPVWSNSGGGSGLVAGRMTALAVDGSTLYAGAADGGVWKRSGGKWYPLTDSLPSLSVGALAVDPSDRSIWVGTGEANTNSDSYKGIGVLRSSDGGKTWTSIGAGELDGTTTVKLLFDGESVFAATDKGLYKRSLSASATTAWTPVLKPSGCSAATGAPGVVYISDVAVKPGSNGRVVDAAVGWRAGSNCNGFYESTDGGDTFAYQTVGGSLQESDMGRTTIAYASNGTLYAVVQSAAMFNQAKTDFGGTILQGVYSSTHGVQGPWNKVAEWRNLANSGSALKAGLGYHPGVQAWYNEFLTVDPANSSHIYLGLEEVFESRDGGQTWSTIGPYWNFGLPCANGPGGLDGCPSTTHSDQHAVAIANGTVYVGNDGGVYSRPLDDSTGWTDLNNGLNTLQYYYADAGKTTSGGDAIWGGLQDNGTSLLLPGAATMVSPFGGDGGDNIVDATNADRAVNEYTDLDMALTTNGGRSDGTTPAYREITPSCYAFTYTPKPCDPNARFIAPFTADHADPSHWVAGGQYVWDDHNAWNTTCGAGSCDWKIVYDTGTGHSITAIGVNKATYVGWCGPCNDSTFQRGVATNYGGTWHALTLPASVPNRFIQGITVDPSDPAHVYLVFNGFSRRWTNDGGYGHVFETTDAGATWADLSGNLPDAPGDAIVLTPSGKLVLATDIGVFGATAGQGTATSWSRFGIGLPNASVNDLRLSPDGSYLLAATHGRGLWKIATP